MLADAAQPAHPPAGWSNVPVPAVNAITAILDKIHEETLTCFPAGCALDEFIAGRADRPAAIQWLTENYHYTKSARYHVGPVLRHAMDAAERRLWQRFLHDESWHWRIYRPALSQFGFSFTDLDDHSPLPTTRLFIEKLRAIAEVSPVAYAAAMIFIERPPTGTELSSDPLYQSLMSYYGFSERLVRPLWWHATENLQAGHSTLGAVVISGRRALDSLALQEALAAVSDTVRAVSGWIDGALSTR